MAHPIPDKKLDLASGAFWGATWGMSVKTWQSLWPGEEALPLTASDLARFETVMKVGDIDLVVRTRWTFADDRLLSIRLSPIEGRGVLGGLLGALGIGQEVLRDEGDGLSRGAIGRTRVDVDGLDGYILLEEEAP